MPPRTCGNITIHCAGRCLPVCAGTTRGGSRGNPHVHMCSESFIECMSRQPLHPGTSARTLLTHIPPSPHRHRSLSGVDNMLWPHCLELGFQFSGPSQSTAFAVSTQLTQTSMIKSILPGCGSVSRRDSQLGRPYSLSTEPTFGAWVPLCF